MAIAAGIERGISCLRRSNKKAGAHHAGLLHIYATNDSGANGQAITATQEGIAALPDYQPLPTGVDLQCYWLARLPAGEKAVLEILIHAHPSPVHRTQIDEATGYQRSSRDAYLSRLAAKNLVIQEHGGMVRASDNLF